MDERVVQFRVGVMVVATLMITAILVVLFGKVRSPFQGTYTVYIRFPEAPGVTPYTPVRKSGIRIGQVAHVDFADDDRSVLVTAKIDRGRSVYHDEICRVNSSLLVGDTALEFVRSGDPDLPKTPLESYETINGKVVQDPTRAVANLQEGLTKTMGNVQGASDEMVTVLRRVNKLLETNDDRITSVIQQADKTLQEFRRATENANTVLGDANVREDFKQTLAQMPEVLKETRDTVARMGRAVSLVEENLRNLDGITRPLGERGEAVAGRIESSTAKLDRLMDEMLKFSQDLNNPQGSIGRLLHDPELYQHVNRAAKNIDELSRELKPILADVRVFTDKVARHPESLGVRGAMQKSTGLK